MSCPCTCSLSLLPQWQLPASTQAGHDLLTLFTASSDVQHAHRLRAQLTIHNVQGALTCQDAQASETPWQGCSPHRLTPSAARQKRQQRPLQA